MTTVKLFDRRERKTETETTLAMPRAMKASVEEVARSAGISTSELLRRFVQLGLEEAARQRADR